MSAGGGIGGEVEQYRQSWWERQRVGAEVKVKLSQVEVKEGDD